jgi:hypothetical protein
MSLSWTCPYCNHDTIVVSTNYLFNRIICDLKNTEGAKALEVRWIACPNDECNRLTLQADLYDYDFRTGETAEYLEHWNLIPQSFAKVFPAFIPKAICTDYEEACSIKDLSPKASATLSRRCLQGMIRDFYGVTRQNLHQEIEAIKDKVDSLTWKSIMATKNIGNIGAHMEQDINLIIDVEPEEAQILINLIELLIKDWYINRHERELMLMSIIAIGETKAEQKQIKPNESEN